MEIIINGRFLTQKITGVQQYARELVQALDAILPTKPGLKITVVLLDFRRPRRPGTT